MLGTLGSAATCLAQASAPPAQPEEIARIVVGFTQTATPQTTPTQHLFADFFFSRPLPAAKVALWGNVRLASSPRPVNSTIATVSADIAKAVLTTPLYEIGQSGEFITGLEYELLAPPAKTSVAAIGAFGATVPLSTSASPNNPQTRFPREYWAGFRFASTNGTTHILDVTMGQNEMVTGGAMHGPVVRVFSEYGMAAGKVGTVYLIGEMQLAGARGPQQADLYRIGVGLDFLQILKASGSN